MLPARLWSTQGQDSQGFPGREPGPAHLAGSGGAGRGRQPESCRGVKGSPQGRAGGETGAAEHPKPDPARPGPALLPLLLQPCCRQCFPFPLTCEAFPASKCQAHKERHCERKMEQECLPASLRKCCLTLHQGSLCKPGTRLTTSSLCWPATAAAPPLNTLFFSPCAVLMAWVTAFLTDTERRGAAAVGALHCATAALGWMHVPPRAGMLGGVLPLPCPPAAASRGKSKGKEGWQQSRGRAGGCSISSSAMQGPAYQQQSGAWHRAGGW